MCVLRCLIHICSRGRNASLGTLSRTLWQTALFFLIQGWTWTPLSAQTPPPVAGPAPAADKSDAPTRREPQGDVYPFVLRIIDPDRRLQGRLPRVIIDNGTTRKTFLPLDDGSPPDTQPGDGSFALGVANFAGSAFKVRLEAGNGPDAITGEGRVSFSPDNLERNLVILIKKTSVAFGTNDEELGLDRTDKSKSATRAGPEGDAPGANRDTDAKATNRALLLWAAIFGLGGGLLGAFLHETHGWWRGKRGLFRAAVGLPMDLFGIRLPVLPGPTVWTVPNEFWVDLTAELTRRLARRGAVLVLPAPDHRERLASTFAPMTDPVWFPATLRPSPAAAIAHVRKLEASGVLVSLVVEGIDAVEEAHPDTPFAALEVLASASPVPVFIVTAAGAPLPGTDWPRQHLTRQQDGSWTLDETGLAD